MNKIASNDIRNQFSLIKKFILLISFLLFINALLLDDLFSIKSMHFIIFILILFLNNSIKYFDNINHYSLLYISTLNAWGILRLIFKPDVLITHTPLMSIVITISILVFLEIKTRILYYTLFFIATIFTIYFFTPLNFQSYFLVYASIYLLSFLINTITYKNYKLQQEFLSKLKSKEKNVTKNLETIISYSNEILNGHFETESSFLKNTFLLTYNLITQADMGTIFIIKNNKLRFIHGLNHHMEELEIHYFNPLPNITDEIQRVNSFKSQLLQMQYEKKDILKYNLKDSKEALLLHIPIDDKVIGISLEIKSDSEKSFTQLNIKTLQGFKSIIMTFYTNRKMTSLKNDIHSGVVFSITNLLENHDHYTKGHSDTVCRIAVHIGRTMNLSSTELLNLYWSARLHDIGKILIPKTILNKKDTLTNDEFNLIKMHTIYGFNAINSSTSIDSLSKYILHHHERFDGSGYPNGLKGKEIPLLSRIISVADSYDAMTSNRSYQPSISKEKAIEEIVRNKNKQFDPTVVDAFLNITNQL